MASIYPDKPTVQKPRMEAMDFHGIAITIEWRKGDRKPDKADPEWSYAVNQDYGFINNTTSPEEEELDVYIGDNKESERVFMASLLHEDGEFNEFKILLGFDSRKQAEEFFRCQYGECRCGPFMEMTMADLKDWVQLQRPKAAKEAKLLINADRDYTDEEPDDGSTGQTKREAIPEPSLVIIPDPDSRPIIEV